MRPASTAPIMLATGTGGSNAIYDAASYSQSDLIALHAKKSATPGVGWLALLAAAAAAFILGS